MNKDTTQNIDFMKHKTYILAGLTLLFLGLGILLESKVSWIIGMILTPVTLFIGISELRWGEV